MNVDHVIALLTQVPFAIIVAGYLLFRMEIVLNQLVINEATEIEILRRIEGKVMGDK